MKKSANNIQRPGVNVAGIIAVAKKIWSIPVVRTTITWAAGRAVQYVIGKIRKKKPAISPEPSGLPVESFGGASPTAKPE